MAVAASIREREVGSADLLNRGGIAATRTE
jgi:hypothetical protein